MEYTAARISPGGRIDAVDGLRGLLILYIVLFHAWVMAPMPPLGILLEHGFAAVDVFFVLSGFMLMRSFIRGGRSFHGGIVAYVIGRIRRLWVPYVLGLILSIVVLIMLSPRGFGAIPWEALPVHLVALQNFSPEALPAIHKNYWFLAALIQLSCLFPFIALASNRWGMGRTFAGCMVLCMALLWLLGPGTYFAKIHYVMIFVTGIAAADWRARSNDGMPLSPRAWVAVLIGAVLALAGLRLVDLTIGTTEIRDAVVLAADAGACLLGVAAIMLCMSDRPNVLRRLCSATWFVRVGAMSYAVYLVHMPVLRLLHDRFVLPTGADVSVQFAVLMTVGLFTVILFSVPFHRAFVAGAARKSAA